MWWSKVADPAMLATQWRLGMARTDITSSERLGMAGYAARDGEPAGLPLKGELTPERWAQLRQG